ncbi:MAG: hypothetical protein NC177_12135 [Ruminococcus flavefaciens]|nr:hypothetical protein [Ruminococcus flavefaciens]
MRKLVSAATSLVMAATMVGAVAPVVAGAADAKKGFSILTYKDATLQEGVKADGATVTVSADAIAAGDVTVPLAIYIDSETPDIVSFGVDATVKSDSADVGKVKFTAYTPGAEDYFAEAHSFKIADGSEITTTKVVAFAGSYNKRSGYKPHGMYNVACDESQTDAGTDNAFVGCVWLSGGEKLQSWYGAKSSDFPCVVFDVTLPKGIAEGDYVIDFCNYLTFSGNASCVLETNEAYETYTNKNLDLNSLTIKVGDAGSSSTTASTATTATTASTSGAGSTTTTTTSSAKPSVDGDVIVDFTNPNSEDGYWRVDEDDSSVVYVDAHVTSKDDTILPISFSMVIDYEGDFGFEVDSVSPAFANSGITANKKLPNFSSITQVKGEGIPVDKDNNILAYLTFTVPDGTPDGLYKISASKAAFMKTSSPETFYTSGVIDGYIAIGDVDPGTSTTTTAGSTTGSTTTTTTTATTANTGDKTTSSATTASTTGKPVTKLYGDTNCDGSVKINDVVLLNKYLNDNKSYAISDQGKINADCYNPKDGKELTAEDSDAIIKSIVHLVELPVNQ